MAKVGFQNRIQGTLGDLTFQKALDSKGNKQDIVKRKGGVSKETFKNASSMARVRENASEFGTAGTLAKGYYNSAKGGLNNAMDAQVFPRLAAVFLASAKGDGTSSRGERIAQMDVLDQDLLGFAFNRKKAVSSVIRVPLTTDCNKATGVSTLTIPALKPKIHIGAAQGATHAKIRLVTSSVMADSADFDLGYAETDYIDLKVGTDVTIPALSNQNQAGSAALIGAVAVVFFQLINNNYEELLNKQFNTSEIVAVV